MHVQWDCWGCTRRWHDDGGDGWERKERRGRHWARATGWEEAFCKNISWHMSARTRANNVLISELRANVLYDSPSLPLYVLYDSSSLPLYTFYTTLHLSLRSIRLSLSPSLYVLYDSPSLSTFYTTLPLSSLYVLYDYPSLSTFYTTLPLSLSIRSIRISISLSTSYTTLPLYT
jgi:hypothetical protein